MKVILHPFVRRDLREVLDYYDGRSDRAGDWFFSEFQAAIEQIEIAPMRFHQLDDQRRRCNLRKFPYHLVYEVAGDSIFITVLRHDKRNPNFGLRRKRRGR
jgi:plasmid stabilization system protein ParE